MPDAVPGWQEVRIADRLRIEGLPKQDVHPVDMYRRCGKRDGNRYRLRWAVVSGVQGESEMRFRLGL